MDTLFYQPEIAKGFLFLDPEESRHCYKVLRKKAGEIIHVTDGKGVRYVAQLTETKPDKCSFKIQSSEKENPKRFHIHVGIAPTKNQDRIEWFVEKAVEIGVDEISFILCDKSERAAMKTERVEKLAISAMKQSLRATLPKINHMVLLKDLITQSNEKEKYIAFVDHANPDQLIKLAKPDGDYIVLIGPEGDFSKKEIELAITHHYKKVGLGPSRLRTETAGLVACHILNLVNS